MMVLMRSKPIRTGATLHTLCITHGPLATFKLYARMYGGAKDDDLDGIHNHTSTLQKWVNQYDLILEPIKGEGRCVTMDSVIVKTLSNFHSPVIIKDGV